jgi:(R,R)-butanediol dehydrogenase/meso-butanediol dehydrogenase/diacetyl reductase
VAFHGLHRDGGGLSEFTVVPRSMAHRVPDGVDPDSAALAEPMAVALRAARRTRAVAGELVVVHGAGPIGIGALLSLRAADVRVAVVDPSPLRRACAVRLGAEVVLDPADDVREAVHALTDGYGADGAVEAAGVPSALRSAVRTTRPDGTVVVVALHHERTLPLSAAHLVHNEVLLTGSLAYADEFPAVLQLMAAGAFPLDGWVRSIGFDRLVPDGFEALARQEAIKVLVRVAGPGGG